ncbi:16S rRNA (cytidine(1402)-2'-O)-methyltransferase [Jeotgalibacillus sp. HH7-29]|uniref:Ribosomal RNA small subunit methyltransferase I n=1 Tax=Jeotgalibacillus haloalkalitolerans TaxID=3104292 RepID=A0ABU5KRG4_9BACL|nr:16S rRNA (cytidine(1402)-2'-O)-methyltransferase [Jeotgalibacillus sp. HH7-29]MDZ5713774.1 16S rRNA (cytidine(1402)-2'-O)-methyltransferase [Jeotgalibacillus sp. HH7-29]
MQTQKSFQHANEGRLYLVPTPIGNLEDMTFRAVNILKEADLIAAEDTRNTKNLCRHFEIETKLVSYHDHNKEESGRKLMSDLHDGKQVALVTDAGTPCISDPGYELVKQCVEEGINVVPLPGANAAVTALIASGLKPQPFYYYGFLPRQKKEKREELAFLSTIPATFILYESPHRLKETLKEMQDALGAERQMSVSRELTKKFEEFVRGTIEECLQWAEETELRGEFCLVIEGAARDEWQQDEEIWWSELSLTQHVEHYIQQKSMTSKAAIKETAKDRGLPKRDVYQDYHVDH